MHRTALLCCQWLQAARAAGAEDCVAVATAATRDARNRRVFLRLLRSRAGLDVRVLSGEEEARLIYLGVSRGLELGSRQALFVDIGGGSTELIVGNRKEPRYLAMLKLGAIRLSHHYLKTNREHPVAPADYRRLQDAVRAGARKIIQQLRRYRLDLAVGSSGTILTLAEIAERRWRKQRLQCPVTLSAARMREIIRSLCALSLTQRRQVPGLQPDRADIIIGGAAILDTLLEEMDISRLTVSDRNLADGLVIENLEKQRGL
jgi:exopolyphosphatase/guanosine-5'-triphosphate,3'-diphosphate pyrophosphatase